MSDKQETATSEGIVGQSVSNGGLERRIFDLWNQAVTEVGDCTYPLSSCGSLSLWRQTSVRRALTW